MSNNIAVEMGPLGITSNVITPGPIANTEGMERLSPKGGHDLSAQVPVGRFGTVKDISNATVFLFSDTGDFINGDILVGKFSSDSRLSPRGSQDFLVVDGASWRTTGGFSAHAVPYPDYLLTKDEIKARGKSNSKL